MLPRAWNSESEQLALAGDGAFAFASSMPVGTPYAVGVMTQPTTPEQACMVANDSDTMGVADVADLLVRCSDAAFANGFEP